MIYVHEYFTSTSCFILRPGKLKLIQNRGLLYDSYKTNSSDWAVQDRLTSGFVSAARQLSSLN